MLFLNELTCLVLLSQDWVVQLLWLTCSLLPEAFNFDVLFRFTIHVWSYVHCPEVHLHQKCWIVQSIAFPLVLSLVSSPVWRSLVIVPRFSNHIWPIEIYAPPKDEIEVDKACTGDSVKLCQCVHLFLNIFLHAFACSGIRLSPRYVELLRRQWSTCWQSLNFLWIWESKLFCHMRRPVIAKNCYSLPFLVLWPRFLRSRCHLRSIA